MSWQAYVDDQLMSTKMVTHAVICGHDGNIWAQSTGFSVSSKLLIKTFLTWILIKTNRFESRVFTSFQVWIFLCNLIPRLNFFEATFET